MLCHTRSAVSLDIARLPVSTYDTVLGATPAWCATSAMVTTDPRYARAAAADKRFTIDHATSNCRIRFDAFHRIGSKVDSRRTSTQHSFTHPDAIHIQKLLIPS